MRDSARNFSVDRVAAELALLAYLDPDSAQDAAARLFESLGFKLPAPCFSFVSANETQALIAGPFVAFRGTESLGDVRDDLGCVLRPLQSLAMPLASAFGRELWHAGFARAYHDVAKAIDFCSKPLGYCILPGLVSVRVYTGHSLGGALATLAVALRKCQEPSALITFGAPRAGNGAAARRAERGSVVARRWVHGSDVVPRLPPALFGFRHAGELCYLRQDGSLDLRSNAISRAVDGLRGRLQAGPLDGLRDHSMSGYARALRELTGSDLRTTQG